MKKIYSLLICIIMIITSVSGVLAEGETEQVHYVAPEAVAEAQALLVSISDSELFSDIAPLAVTRATFIEAVMDVLSLENITGGNLPFGDVTPDASYADAVYGALQMGLISPGTNFRPDDEITYNEAVKIAVSAMGYSKLAEYSGGYPYGYIKTANDKDILEYIENADIFTGEHMAVLLYNMLCGDILEAEYITSDSVKYSRNGPTLLYSVYGILHTEGVVTKTHATSYDINYRYSAQEQTVEVDGNGFRSDISLNDCFGMNCIVYYTEKDNRVVCAHPVNNREITVSLENVQGIEGASFRYYPEEGSKLKSLKIDSNYIEVYNGKTTYADKKHLDGAGNVRLVDNNEDGTYDILFVNRYDYVKVKNVDVTDRVIEDMHSAASNISIDETEVLFEVSDSEGNTLRLADIKAEDVLCVLRSLDGNVVNISIISEIFSGNVEAITDDSRIVIGGSEYILSDYARTYCVSELKLGTPVSFYPGFYGEIAYVDIESDIYSYGYVTKIAERTGMESTYQIKMFTSSGIMKIYDFAEKVTYNGVKDKCGEVYEQFTADFAPQLIRYRLNGEGMISAIDTAVTLDMSSASVSDIEAEKSEDDRLTKYEYADTSFSYRSNGSFGTSFNATGAIIFALPVVAQTTNIVDTDNEEEFDIMSISEVRSGTTYSYFDVYDVDEFGLAKVLVSYSVARNSSPHSFASAMSSSYSGGMVSKITNGISPEGESGYMVEIWTNGKYNKYFMASDVSVPLPEGDKLSVGDVVRFKLKNGEIDALMVDINADSISNNRTYDTRSATFNAGDTFLTYQIGQLYSFNTSVCSYSVVSDAQTGIYDFTPVNQRVSQMRSNNICRYDRETGTVQSISPSDLRSYKVYGDMADIVALKQQNLSTQTIYVFGKGDK